MAFVRVYSILLFCAFLFTAPLSGQIPDRGGDHGRDHLVEERGIFYLRDSSHYNVVDTLTGEFVPNTRTYYTYDDDCFLTEELGQAWQEDIQGFVDALKILVEWDANEQVAARTTLIWNSVDEVWQNLLRYEYTYTPEGLVTYEDKFSWDLINGGWELDHTLLFEYETDGMGNVTQTTRLEFFMDTWVPKDRVLSRHELMPGFTARIIHTGNMTIALWEIKKGAVLPRHQHPPGIGLPFLRLVIPGISSDMFIRTGHARAIRRISNGSRSSILICLQKWFHNHDTPKHPAPGAGQG